MEYLWISKARLGSEGRDKKRLPSKLGAGYLGTFPRSGRRNLPPDQFWGVAANMNVRKWGSLPQQYSQFFALLLDFIVI